MTPSSTELPSSTRGPVIEASPGPSARERLLTAILEQARAGGLGGAGLGDVSLRQLAAAVGTSHRMLLYHFGSKEGLVAAVVAAVEARQRDVLTRTAVTWAGDPVGAMRAFWADLADPAQHEAERLFFEAVVLALRGRPGTEALRESLVEPWLAVAAEAARLAGAPVPDARLDARVGMALTRGLLLDLLVTGDRAGVDAAVEHYLGRHLTSGAHPPIANDTVTDTATSEDPVAIGTAPAADRSTS